MLFPLFCLPIRKAESKMFDIGTNIVWGHTQEMTFLSVTADRFYVGKETTLFFLLEINITTFFLTQMLDKYIASHISRTSW